MAIEMERETMTQHEVAAYLDRSESTVEWQYGQKILPGWKGEDRVLHFKREDVETYVRRVNNGMKRLMKWNDPEASTFDVPDERALQHQQRTLALSPKTAPAREVATLPTSSLTQQPVSAGVSSGEHETEVVLPRVHVGVHSPQRMAFSAMSAIDEWLEEHGMQDVEMALFQEIPVQERRWEFISTKSTRILAEWSPHIEGIQVSDGTEQERVEREKREREQRLQETFQRMDEEIRTLRAQVQECKIPSKSSMIQGIGPQEKALYVTVEARNKTIFVSYPNLPTFVASGPTEEEALANFKLMLRPMYDVYLCIPDARMTDMQRIAFQMLVDIFDPV